MSWVKEKLNDRMSTSELNPKLKNIKLAKQKHCQQKLFTRKEVFSM